MISESIKGLVKNSSAIRAMFEEGSKMAKEFGAENVYDFSIGNPSVEPPKTVKNAIKLVMEETEPSVLHGYMNNSGFEDVRKAVADSINKKHGTEFTAKNIIMTVGAAGGINVILRAIADPGKEIITFAPFFGEYTNYAANVGAKLIPIQPKDETFMPDVEAMKNAITKDTVAVIINNPNNPTGVVYPKEVLEDIARALEECEKKFGTDIYIISDEPYREIVFDDAEVSYITKIYKNSIIGYSYSKSLSLPGERIGYLVIPTEVSDFEDLVSAANVATRILGFVNAPSLQQKFIKHCVDDTVDMKIYKKNRDLLMKSLSEMGFDFVKPEGAFYLFLKSPVADEKEFVAEAKKRRLLLVPGSSFGYGGYVRLAYCVDYKMIERSLPAFEDLAHFYRLK